MPLSLSPTSLVSSQVMAPQSDGSFHPFPLQFFFMGFGQNTLATGEISFADLLYNRPALPLDVRVWGALEVVNDTDTAYDLKFKGAQGTSFPLAPGDRRYMRCPVEASSFTFQAFYQNPQQLHPDEHLTVIFYTEDDIKNGWLALNAGNTSVNPNQAGGAGSLVFNVKLYGAVGNGVADDTLAIQQAISFCQLAGGGIVWFPPGSYLVTSTLTIQQNMAFMGAGGMGSGANNLGTSRIIGGASMGGSPGGMVGDLISTPIPAVQNAAGFTQLNLRILDLLLDCSTMGSSNPGGFQAGFGNAIHLYGCRYSTVRGVDILGAPNWSMLIEGDSTNFSYNNWIDHNRGETNNGAGIRLASGTEANWIDHNDFNECGSATHSAQPVFGTQSTQANHLWVTAGYCWILDNLFETNGSYTTAAVQLDNSGPVRVMGNRFDHVRNQAILSNAPNAMIVGNQIGAAGIASPGTKSAIEIAGGATGGRVIVVGNTIHQDGQGATYKFGVVEDGPAGLPNLIADNWIETGSTGFVGLAAGSLSKVHHNIGPNPGGNFGPPAVPASGTALINSSGFDQAVSIATLGTLTSVAIGGVARTDAPAVGSTYRVPAGQTITLTYAGAAPTWQWFGD